MKGKKKVSDYLTDRKFSLVQKEQQWVLCCGNDIIWLVGERTDNRYRVDEHTRKNTDRKTAYKIIRFSFSRWKQVESISANGVS